MQFPTGGKAHEPSGMIRCDSGADSIVWMKEEESMQKRILYKWQYLLWRVFLMTAGAFFMHI